MSTRQFSIVAGAVVATAALTTYIANAGDINPPPGPIEGTGVSTSQLAGLQSGGISFVREFEAIGGAYGGLDASPVDRVTGSGILHAVIVSGISSSHGLACIEVEDLSGNFIGSFTSPAANGSAQQNKVVLNVRYTQGLRVRRAINSTGYSLIYAPDP